MVQAMPLTDRIRDHAGQGAPTVAAQRTRRRLRADRARQLADLLRHQLLTWGFPAGTLPHESSLATDYRASRNTVREALDLLRAISGGRPISSSNSAARARAFFGLQPSSNALHSPRSARVSPR